jgi:hypothetical protein
MCAQPGLFDPTYVQPAQPLFYIYEAACQCGSRNFCGVRVFCKCQAPAAPGCILITCVAANSWPWNLCITVNVPSRSSKQAVGYRKSRGFARPLDPAQQQQAAPARVASTQEWQPIIVRHNCTARHCTILLSDCTSTVRQHCIVVTVWRRQALGPLACPFTHWRQLRNTLCLAINSQSYLSHPVQ